MPSNIIQGSADHAPCTQVRQASAVNSGTSVNGSRRRALNKSTIKPEARELTQWVIERAIKQVASQAALQPFSSRMKPCWMNTAVIINGPASAVGSASQNR